MSTQRILLLSYLLLGVVLGLVLEQGIQALSGFGPLGFFNKSLLGLEGWTWATFTGFGLALAGGIYCWKNERIHTLSVQVIEELERVTWPTLAETRVATVAVIVVSLICAVMLGLFDYGWGSLTQQVYTP